MKYFLFCLVCITAMEVSCKKGDIGPAGPQGTQGIPGVVGAAGADGSVIYSGTIIPAATLGKNGDYYLNLTSGILYGPKTASGWGSGFSMKGAQGTQIYNGAGAPNPSLGAAGDYYMDTVAHNLYGPKQATGWGNPVPLTGPAGANGSTIESGTGAPATSIGAVGDFYIDLAAGMLYGPKTSSGWGAGVSLKGANGSNGAAGATGAAGAAGTKVYSGTGAPASTLGTIGDFYMDTVAHNLYGPKLTVGWGVAIALQGPAGTANVQYTPWFDPIAWSGYNTTNQRFIYFDQPVPAITQAIVNSGTVLVYGYLGDYSTDIWPKGTFGLLPLTVGYYVQVVFTSTYFEDTWQSWITEGNVRIKIIESPNYDLTRFKGNSIFRVVIIPGGVSVPAGIGYKELKQYLHVNIPD